MHRITGNGGQDSLIEMSPTDSYNGELVNSARFVVKLRIRRGVSWPRSPPLFFFCHLDKRRPWGGMQGVGEGLLRGLRTWENLFPDRKLKSTEETVACTKMKILYDVIAVLFSLNKLKL